MRDLLFIALALACAGGLGACGLERPETTFPEQDLAGLAPDMGAGVDQGGVQLGDGRSTGEMTGTWLLVNESSSCLLKQEQVAVTEYLITIVQEGQALVETPVACALTLSPVLGVPVRVPDATRESIVFARVDTGRVSAIRVGAGYESSTEVGLWGMRLDDPLRDDIPRDEDDPRVIDADGDGMPGVSFDVGLGEGCQRFAAQRQIVNYNGFFERPNLISGTSTTRVDARVFGATMGTCAVAPALQPNDRQSRFKMARVDGQNGAYNADLNGDGQITCDEIRGLGLTLQPSREADPTLCD